jgi:SnoaL-like domain
MLKFQHCVAKSTKGLQMASSADLVIPRLFAAIDDHRFADLPAFYTADVQAHTAVGHISGREELVATLRAIHEPIPVLQHLVTGVIVDSNGNDADVRANVVAFFGDEEHRPTLEGASVWRGRLHRSDDDWQLSEVNIDMVWTRGSMPTE